MALKTQEHSLNHIYFALGDGSLRRAAVADGTVDGGWSHQVDGQATTMLVSGGDLHLFGP
ncbi:MAG: hypothetical protein GY928_30150, partial [Colwellia sp.]|nr:hypothetical protein [Colwellia sp.]